MFLAILLTLFQVAQPIPDPVPNGNDVVAGPFDLFERFASRFDRSDQDSQRQYHGLLSGIGDLRTSIKDSIQSTVEAARDAREAALAAREARQAAERGTGPIRESIALLYKLVMACVMLVGLLVLLRLFDYIAPLIKRPIQ